jgi:dTDP-4-amino-4,6-dideoxygalactose transaminase
VACLYIEGIKNPRVKLPDVLPEEQNVYHIFPVLCASRDRLQSYLLEKGIQTMVHYPIPPHQQTCMKAWNNRSFPITELIHQQELSLPMSQVLRDDEVQNVIEVINSQCL